MERGNRIYKFSSAKEAGEAVLVFEYCVVCSWYDGLFFYVEVIAA